MILVTGASGFIATHIVEQLLAAGYSVRGTVRSLSIEKTRALRALPGANERLELVLADLNNPSSLKNAVQGCEFVLHTASPYEIQVKDPQRDLVDPAVRGTRGVLDAVVDAGGVKRVVLTSSFAAITDEPNDSHVFSEADWNYKSTLTRNPYYFSKTLAEKTAWGYVQSLSQDKKFELVVINPFIVMGPSHMPSINQSNRIIADMYTGKYPGIVDISWGIVDVRDVARAHILAMERPDASGRYLTANRDVPMTELLALLRTIRPSPFLPTKNLQSRAGTLVVKASSYFRGAGLGSYMRSQIGNGRYHFDNSRVQKHLGLSFRPIEQTVTDTVANLDHWGHLPKVSPNAPRTWLRSKI